LPYQSENMQKYIDQLVEDLCDTAQNPPAPSFIEVPPHLEEMPDTAELAITPFKTIEDLTGISQEVFPEMIQLDADQCRQVNEAIFKVFNALHIELVDTPTDIPPEILYDVLTDNWDHPVQFLPSSGMDLELCSGDPMTCPYGDYCDCGEEFDEYEIPHRFYSVLPKIAESIDAGLICFLNPDTLEIEEIPKSQMDDPQEFGLKSGNKMKDLELMHERWDEYYEIEPLESHESFKIMVAFTEDMENDKFRDKLIHALNHQKPFANFKWKIDNSPHKQDWFDFRQQWLEEHVKKIICIKISESFPSTESNGFFDDDGTPINPEEVPLPNLCVICKSHISEDQKENLLCLMTRHDQRDSDDFKCDAFEKID